MVDIEMKNLIISKINEIYNKYPDIKNPDSYVKKMVRINDLHSYELEALERKKTNYAFAKIMDVSYSINYYSSLWKIFSFGSKEI